MKSGRSIYIVDDDPDDRMLMRGALEETVDSVHVVEVGSGHDLMDLLDSQQESLLPKLILMDMNMPVVNGLEALACVRSRLEREHIPVIMLSTSSDQRLIDRAYRQGVNAYLTKPASFRDYILIAEAISVCFLNNPPSLAETKNHDRSFRNQSILVIEDNADHWELIQAALSRGMPGATLVHRDDASSTLDFLAHGWLAQAPELRLVLLDLYLPTCQHGLDLLEQIRGFLTLHGLSSIPVVIFSGSDRHDYIRNCYRRHANIYVVKPASMSEALSYCNNLSLLIGNTSRGSGRDQAMSRH